LQKTVQQNLHNQSIEPPNINPKEDLVRAIDALEVETLRENEAHFV